MIKLRHIIENYEKGDPIIFNNDMLDHRAGESFLTLYASTKDGNPIGKIDYSTYGNEIAVKYIKTSPAVRRQGVASEMAKELQRLYPDKEINWGSTTDDGSKFLDKLSRSYSPNKRYSEITQRLEFLNKKKVALDKIYTAWHELYDRDPQSAEKLKPKINSLNGAFQRVHDEIWELEQELIPMKAGTWKVNLKEDEELIDKNRLFDSPDYLERVAEKLGYETNFSKVFWNQPFIPTLYHCTTPENYEIIKTEGLKLRNERRGAISNRHIGPAIFTTSEEDEVSFFSSYYGNVVIKINARQMKADHFTPEVEKEPDWAYAEMLEFVLHKMGEEDAEAARFVDSSDQNTSGTVIIYSDIPVKYLSLAS